MVTEPGEHTVDGVATALVNCMLLTFTTAAAVVPLPPPLVQVTVHL
jgi:hypothetical protein